MKKILLIALVVAQSDIQAMSLKDKISKIFSKCSCVLSPIIQEVKNEEKKLEDANRKSRKNSLPMPIANSSIVTNRNEFYSSLSDIENPDYILNVRKGEIFFSDGFSQSSQNPDSIYEDEGIFDIEQDYGQSLSGYLSEEYFPSLYRKKQLHDIREHRQRTSNKPMRRRRSSIDMYYHKYNETDQKNRAHGESAAKITYGAIWCETKTLKENLKNLVIIFLDRCCDLSFKILEQENEIYVGEFNSGERLIFCGDEEETTCTGEEMCIYGKSGARRTVPSWRIPVFLGDTPFSFTDEYVSRLNETLLEMVQNPIGAELLRTVITKRIINGMPKLVFIPVQNTNISLEAGNQVQRYFAQYRREIANYLIRGMRDRFVLYNPKCPSDTDARVIKYDTQLNKCVLDVKDVPFRVSLFNTLIHSLRTEGSQLSGDVSFMAKRPNNALMVPDFNKEISSLEIRIPSFSLKKILYVNDEGYRSMLGLTREGIDLLCEAAYTTIDEAEYIRMSPTKYDDVQVRIDQIFGEDADQKQKITDFVYRLSPKQWDNLFSQYIEQDKECYLFKYFLTHKNKCPKFGVGQYGCTEI